MALTDCIAEVEKAVGRELNKDERRDLGRSVSNVIKRLQREGVDDLEGRLQKELQEMVSEKRAAALKEQINAALNLQKQTQAIEQFVTHWGDSPKEGLKALLGNSVLDRAGARNGVAVHQDSLSANYTSGLNSRLASEGLLDVAATGALDDQIWLAMSELNRKAPNSERLAKLSPEAVKIARIMNDMNELARTHANKAGASIGKLDGYVVRRTHDVVAIQKAAGSDIPINDPRHEKAWKEFVMERLDWEKSMKDIPIEDRDRVLSSMYQQMSNGYHLRFSDQGVPGLKGPQNIAKKMSHERVLHFKTPEAEFEYHKKFAQGSTLLENMSIGLMHMGRDTALMRKLGPNARANLEAVVEKLSHRYTAEGKGHLARELQDQLRYETDRGVWKMITGEAAIPGNAPAAAWGQLIRNWNSMTKLGAAVLSGFSDIPAYASAMRYAGDRSQHSFFNGMADAFSHAIGEIGKSPTSEQKILAAQFGIMLDALTLHASPMTADTTVAGRTSNWVNKFFKLNGLSGWQDRLRLGAIMAQGHEFAGLAGKGFDELPAGKQAMLRQFNISASEWDVVRAGQLFEDSEGRSFLTPEAVTGHEDTAFSKLLAERNLKETPGNIERVKTELADKYRSMFTEFAAMATSEPGKIERAMLLQGTQSGTWAGEAARFVGQFKSFTVSTMRKHLARELWGYGGENLSLPQALAAIFSGKNMSGMQGMANLMVFGTLFGYASMSAKDIVKGRTPRVPTDAESFAKIFAASAAQSGAFGVYGDFLFGEAKSRFGHSPLETFLGPTVGNASDLVSIMEAMKSGQDVGAKSFQFVLNNVPGTSLFYSRWALDYMITYRMQEAMNPGYLRRMERRLKEEKQQEFLVPPSSVIGYGGR